MARSERHIKIKGKKKEEVVPPEISIRKILESLELEAAKQNSICMQGRILINAYSNRQKFIIICTLIYNVKHYTCIVIKKFPSSNELSRGFM